MSTPIQIAINGFGRIGRKIARLALGNDQFRIVAINDLGDLQTMAHLLKYDSTHGTLPYDVIVEGDSLVVAGKKIRFTKEKNPAQLPWKTLGANIVHECTGIFTDKAGAGQHLQAGASRVIVSAPSADADITVCMGVNERAYEPSKHTVISNASCTTNCLAPLVKVLDDAFGVVRGTMMTVHSYTNDQNILDLPHKDLRRARAAAVSMIPTTTGAAKAVGLVLPHLKGKLDGLSIRVPTPNVSVVDFTGEVRKACSKEDINTALEQAANGALRGILGVSKAPLVSCDFNGNTLSSIADLALTSVMEKTLVKVISWYDNESGFSQRMLDLTSWIATRT